MGTKIEWAEETWNPITGCTKISEACQNCYAERMSKRLAGRCGYDKENPFKVTLHPEKLDEPLKWKKPRIIFVCSMGDLFHEDVPDKAIIDVLSIIAEASWHTFLILTKRPERMKEIFTHETIAADVWLQTTTGLSADKPVWPLPNLWLGVTAENQQRADERIPTLLSIPVSVHFVSCEPLLGPINLEWYLRNPDLKAPHWLDWVICGGETGPGARPMHPDWVRSLREQCQEAGTPFFFKQWGEYCADNGVTPHDKCKYILWGARKVSWKVGKKAAGRLLDGREWNQRPNK